MFLERSALLLSLSLVTQLREVVWHWNDEERTLELFHFLTCTGSVGHSSSEAQVETPHE